MVEVVFVEIPKGKGKKKKKDQIGQMNAIFGVEQSRVSLRT